MGITRVFRDESFLAPHTRVPQPIVTPVQNSNGHNCRCLISIKKNLNNNNNNVLTDNRECETTSGGGGGGGSVK